MRKGKHINTYSGIHFYPLDAKKEEILVGDIAHALSLLCRGNGHLKHFYSVGQHSINCAKEAEARGYSYKVQLACLLHDGSEAYLSDITRPVKHLLPSYLEIEDQLQNQIYQVFGVDGMTDKEWQKVKAVDDDLLHYEMTHLMANYNHEADLVTDPKIDFIAMDVVEKDFIHLFERLSALLG